MGETQATAKGRASGIAAHRSFLTYVATVVEVEVNDQGEISIPRVDTAVDAGMVVNPERTRAQFEGAAVFGAASRSSARSRRRKREDRAGELRQLSASRGSMKRHTRPMCTLWTATAPPAGVGEPGVPPFAPAHVQCYLRRHREAHSGIADRETGVELTFLKQLSEPKSERESAARPGRGRAFGFGIKGIPARRDCAVAERSRSWVRESVRSLTAQAFDFLDTT